MGSTQQIQKSQSSKTKICTHTVLEAIVISYQKLPSKKINYLQISFFIWPLNNQSVVMWIERQLLKRRGRVLFPVGSNQIYKN